MKKKVKIWSTPNADRKIAEFIKERDNHTCVFCGRKSPYVIMDPSHYWGRYVSATRFHPDNLDAVCRGCHFKIEHAKQGIYREFKLKQLGEQRYKELEKLYYQSKMTRSEAIKNLMEFLSTTEV